MRLTRSTKPAGPHAFDPRPTSADPVLAVRPGPAQVLIVGSRPVSGLCRCGALKDDPIHTEVAPEGEARWG
jgi:hypothetical protein